MRTVFYGWQSDTPKDTNRDFIAVALDAAIRSLGTDLVLDRDVRGVPGMAPIGDTILQKIRSATLCAMDLTIVATHVGRQQRSIPNSNVLIELGFALAARGPDSIICIMNEHYGRPEELPFDLRHRNVSVRYKLGPFAADIERQRELAELTVNLAQTLRIALENCAAAAA
jgi:hypothetical protein